MANWAKALYAVTYRDRVYPSNIMLINSGYDYV